ncbi:MAG: aminoglycoside phosphotransferase family protein [Pyrinomonadaceae bacterium]
MSDFLERLERFLAYRGESPQMDQLTPDASTREYFRISWRRESAIACVYPESFIAAEQSYLDVTKLFSTCDLPVARVIDFDESLGIILIEDLGDRILRDEIKDSPPARREELVNAAIDLIPRIQAATKTAFETNSIASRLRFDAEKLSWELDFFKTHYFTTLKQQPLDAKTDAAVTAEFAAISRELETRATVLCHRDFHAANLMLDKYGELRIIDHQDARIGSPTYDLVSLLLDRVLEPPSPEWLAEKRKRFLESRVKLGLEPLDEASFAAEFRLQTIQRCLKAVGTFSFQSTNRGKTYFLPFIKPMFQIVLRAADNVGIYPSLRSILYDQLS